MIDAQEREKYLLLKQQVLPFDFWEEEKKIEQARLQAEEEARQKAEEEMPQFENPRNDNQELLQFQYQYKHGDQDALKKMYELSEQLCMKFINAIGKNNKHIKKMAWDEKKIKAADAASYLIEQYLTRRDFIITKNVPGYLFLRVEKELFYRRKVDEIVDFVDLALFFKEGEEDAIREE